MESSPDRQREPLAHYSTGRLTPAQAVIVAAWRDRLHQDVPLPGQPPKSEALRLLGLDDRPPASCSDVIAVAVRELLELAPPDGLEVARYAHRAALAQQLAGQGHRAEGAGICQPVSFYLPWWLRARYEALREAGGERVRAVLAELHARAAREHPGRASRAERERWLGAHLSMLGLPGRAPRITGGTIARMAIDHAASRAVEPLLRAAVVYAADVHNQPHRARRDMHRLTR